jgi:hypothetical protein
MVRMERSNAFRVHRRNEDFYSRRNRLAETLLHQQQQEGQEPDRDRVLQEISLDKILRAE